MTFPSLGLPRYFSKTLKSQNYDKPYPIQERAIPSILAKKDVLGIAQTGSGKTASYILPLLANLENVKTEGPRHIKALVLVPTRELALQVHEVIKQFTGDLPFRCRSLAVHGGVSINVQMLGLTNINILVATPGRLLDLVSKNAIHLSVVKMLVLDEADKMLNLGFKKEMDEIFKLLPRQRQNLLFSATLSPNVEDVQRVLLQNPEVINIAPKEDYTELIQQSAYALTKEQKGPLLRALIKKNQDKQILIFTSSIHQADLVVTKLNKNKIKAKAIHGKKSQLVRNETLNSFKRGKLRILIATDLLARGIDIEFLPMVINYELPRSPKDYIHRIGRTGRAKNPGEAISFITEEDLHHFKVIQKKMKRHVELKSAQESKDLIEKS